VNYARAVRVWTAAFGLRQDEMAALAGVGPSQLSLISRGKRRPSRACLERVAASLGVPLHVFVLPALGAADLAAVEDAAALTLLRELVGASRERLALRSPTCPAG
jgi:transcriptional regulator with XRE-family HTH domain